MKLKFNVCLPFYPLFILLSLPNGPFHARARAKLNRTISLITRDFINFQSIIRYIFRLLGKTLMNRGIFPERNMQMTPRFERNAVSSDFSSICCTSDSRKTHEKTHFLGTGAVCCRLWIGFTGTTVLQRRWASVYIDATSCRRRRRLSERHEYVSRRGSIFE